MTIQSVERLYDSVASGFARQWRRLMGSDDAASLGCWAQDQIAEIARDVGVSPGELRSLARRGPDAADLLVRRMDQLGLDRGEVSRTEPGAFHDMQRVCTLCAHHKRCAKDFAHDRKDEAWQS